MKISIDVECTPQEARDFFGVPDLKAVQDRIVAEMERRMEAGLASMDPQALLKMWMPGGSVADWQAFQQRFWDQFGKGMK